MAIQAQQSGTIAELVRFLLARVDEDEAELRRRRRPSARSIADPDESGGLNSAARQQAECAAKRRVIGSAQHLVLLRDLPNEKDVREGAADLLHAMAAVYNEHPCYRGDWARRRTRLM